MNALILSMLIQLPIAPCPLWISALALGRRRAHEDMSVIEFNIPLDKKRLKILDDERIRFQRELLRRWLQVRKGYEGKRK